MKDIQLFYSPEIWQAATINGKKAFICSRKVMLKHAIGNRRPAIKLESAETFTRLAVFDLEGDDVFIHFDPADFSQIRTKCFYVYPDKI